MSEFMSLRESVDTLASRAPAPDFEELSRRAVRRGRRRLVMVGAATVAVVVGWTIAITGPTDGRRTAPANQTTSTSADAERIIADGHLYSYDATDSGVVVTVWTDCEDELDATCGHAWRMGVGGRALAAGVAAKDVDHAYFTVRAGADGFVLYTPRQTYSPTPPSGWHIGLDGTAARLPACRPAYPEVEPGRLAWAGLVIDTRGVHCPTRFGAGEPSSNILTARGLAHEGAFTDDGTLWALVNNEDAPPKLTVGKYDGATWDHTHLRPQGSSASALLGAAGSSVVVLAADGLSVTTDDGASWQEATDSPALRRRLPFPRDPEAPDAGFSRMSMAFAGASTLYVADARGGLWRSPDLVAFHRVEAPALSGLQNAGESVLANVRDTEELVRITAGGSVERVIVR